MSLQTGQVSYDWKIANFSQIVKKGKCDNPSNYRPISLTSVVSKLMEKIYVRQFLASWKITIFCLMLSSVLFLGDHVHYNSYPVLNCGLHTCIWMIIFLLISYILTFEKLLIQFHMNPFYINFTILVFKAKYIIGLKIFCQIGNSGFV